jgi:sugar/nucleoside kinase (ribokinase family)
MSVYDVTGIGNAIVDVLCPCEDQFLVDYGIEKGAMTLIDEDRAKELYDAMEGKATEKSGGSVANTMAGIASFGGKGAYIGLVANDPLGHAFTLDINDIGVAYSTAPYIQGLETARSFIFITPDGERSMNTFLGACTELSIEHVNSFMISNSDITVMEGYLFDKDPAKEAYFMASRVAHENDKKVAITLSDSFCVERHKDDFRKLVNGNIDILFGNTKELCALFDTDDIDDAAKQAAETCELVISTRGKDGVFIINGNNKVLVATEAVENVVDLTGAGDQLAAGFLYGLTHNLGLEKSGQLGVRAASEVITHIGPRPHIEYKSFLND